MGGCPARTGVRKRRVTVGWLVDCFGFARCRRCGCGPSTGQRAVSRSGTRGRGLSVGGRLPVRRAGCVPANRAPKGANPEKISHARAALRSCPPHTAQARVEPRPGEQARGRARSARRAKSGAKATDPFRTSLPTIRNICPESVASVAPEVRRVCPS